jgi:uncharacterized protein (TIRG00374 family)
MAAPKADAPSVAARVTVPGRARSALSRRLRVGIGFLVSAATLVLALRNVNFEEMAAALAQTNLLLLVAALGVSLATNLAKAARWRLLFYPQEARLRLGKLFSVLLIGQTVNAVLPVRLGEIVRAYLIGEIEGVSKAFALFTVVVEKLLDSLLLLVCLVVLLPQGLLPGWLKPSGIVVSLILVGIFGLLLLAAQQQERLRRLGRAIIGRLPFQERLGLLWRLEAAVDSLGALRRWDVGLGLIALSVVVWIGSAGVNAVVFQAMGLNLSWWAAVFLLVVLQVGGIIPSSPGRIGVFHYLTVLALSVFAVEPSLALSYALVLHLVVFVPMTLLGAFFMGKENYDLAKLTAAGTQWRREGALPPSSLG